MPTPFKNISILALALAVSLPVPAGAVGTRTATFVYAIPAGSNPDHLEIVAAGANAPSSFLIERSPNNLSYVPIVSYEGETGWAAGEKRVSPFTLASKPVGGPETAAHKFWRVAVERWNTDAYSGLAEVVFRDGSGRDITVGGKGTVIGATPSRHKHPFDKDYASAWYDDAYTRRLTAFQYEFAQPQALASVDISADYGLAGPRKSSGSSPPTTGIAGPPRPVTPGRADGPRTRPATSPFPTASPIPASTSSGVPPS